MRDDATVTDANGARFRAIDGIDPHEVGFDDALAGGVTSVVVKPGSGNPIGGRTVGVKTWGRTTFDADLTMETLTRVLDGELAWDQHTHRADDIITAIRLSEEFDYRLVINHGTEGHLVADTIAERDIPVIFSPLITSRAKVELRGRTLRALTVNPASILGLDGRVGALKPGVAVLPGVLTEAVAQALRSSRAMTMRWIWLVPSKICGTFASRM